MLKSLKINNYKSILDMPRIKFGNEVSFIIGKNGSGKSTLISALFLTRELADRKSLEAALSGVAPFGFELFTGGANRSAANIELTVKNREGVYYRFFYSMVIAKDSFGGDYAINEESLFRFDNAAALSDDQGRLIYTRTEDRIKAPSKKSQTQELEDIPLNVSPSELVLANYSDPTVSEVAQLIRGYRILWYERADANNSFTVHTQDKLDTHSLDAMIVNLYKTDPGAFEKAVRVIRQLIPEFEAPMVRTIAPPSTTKEEKGKLLERYIVFWRENNSLEYTISGLSDGNYRVIQLIFALFSAKGSTCLVGEEIENGQHYGRLQTLLEVIRVLAVKLEVQLIFTTHSIELLRYVSPSDVIYCSKDDSGHSTYTYLVDKVNVEDVSAELEKPATAKDLLELGMI